MQIIQKFQDSYNIVAIVLLCTHLFIAIALFKALAVIYEGKKTKQFGI